MSDESALLAAMLRSDFSSFVAKTFTTLCPEEIYRDNWHLDCLSWHLARAAEGKRVRLIINLPPRSLKSIAASVALSAWLLGLDPSGRVISVSYSDDLARKHARDTRTILEAGWYRRAFPATRVNPRKNTETEFTTTRQGFRLATSIGGTLTGRGGRVIIIDDPIKPADAESEAERRRVNEWYDKTLYSRLDDKEAGAIILVMQRLHEDDLTGHLIEKGEFEILSLPAIATERQLVPIGKALFHERLPGEALHPDRESPETLQRIKSSIGTRIFEAQYQQSPVPAEGNLFKAGWLRRYPAAPMPSFSEIVQSWDTATKLGANNDYSACTTWGIHQNTYYLLDVHRGRWEFPELLRTVLAQAEHRQIKTVLIEDANSGAALIQSLRQTSSLNVIAVKPTLDKMTRAAQQSAAFEAGRVLLPEAAPWLVDFEKELLAFPNGRYDDQLDSAVQFLNWAAARVPHQVPIFMPDIFIIPRSDPRWDIPADW